MRTKRKAKSLNPRRQRPHPSERAQDQRMKSKKEKSLSRKPKRCFVDCLLCIFLSYETQTAKKTFFCTIDRPSITQNKMKLFAGDWQCQQQDQVGCRAESKLEKSVIYLDHRRTCLVSVSVLHVVGCFIFANLVCQQRSDNYRCSVENDVDAKQKALEAQMRTIFLIYF